MSCTSRRASVITELEGRLQLYAPSFQNGGVVSIDGFRHQPDGLPARAGADRLIRAVRGQDDHKQGCHPSPDITKR